MSSRSEDAPLSVAFHIDQLWFSAPGGIGTYVRQLGTELERSGQVMLTPFRSRWKHDAAGVPATTVPIVTTGMPARTAYLGWSVARRPKLPHELDGCQVVHATNPATIPPIRDGQSLVVTIHDLTFEDEPDAFPATWLRLYRRGLDIARKEAAIVLVPSEYVGGRLQERGIATDRLRVTPLAGMPVPVPAPTLPPEAVVRGLGIEGPYLVSVGTFEPRKNQARLVRAYRRAVTDASLPHALVLAGHPGWRTDELDAALAEEGPGRIVRLEGLGDLEIDALYRAADAAAYISLSEGFGMPVLEAMSRGTPVVASSTTSIPEVAGDAALLVDPTDEAAIATSLTTVLTEATVRSDLRRRGYDRAGRFTWEATARATLDAYRQAVEAR